MSQPSKSSLRELWDRQPPKRKSMVVAIGALSVFLLGSYLLVSNTDPRKTQKTPADLKNLITGADTRQLGMSGMQNDVERLTRALNDANERIARLEKQGPSPSAPGATPSSTVVPLPTVGGDKNGSPTQTGSKPEEGKPPTPPGANPQANYPPGSPFVRPPGTGTGVPGRPGDPAMAQQEKPKPPPPPPQIYVIDAAGAREAGSEAPKAEQSIAVGAAAPTEAPGVFVPAGSIVNGVMITGVDAPAGQRSNAEPLPALIRVKKEAILPNHYHVDVRECFIVAATYGDLPSERMYGRSESLSCVRADGRVLEASVQMYLVGEDGKAGMRGRLINKQGALVAKMLMAGFADGMAKALQPYRVPVIATTGGGGVAQFQDVGSDAAKAGFYGGAATTLEKLSDHFMKLADQMTPVIEVDAGRNVTLVMLHGAELKLNPSPGVVLPQSIAWASTETPKSGG